ncbi:MAG: glucuronate isomerase [Spirochaetaceae bacterium]|jgi:glucuronate isomerase|nr:glucuronate isomerase [Spirochaetaceae bacterium]
MKKFMDRDFLLTTKTAQELYHEAAADEPIFDYHCHLIPEEIAANRRFSNLAEIWLGGDHYKWRALRSNGVDESLITDADADPYDKFLAWAETVPRLMGNPLYHWTHLELQRYFDISDPLNRESAPAIWKAANEKLEKDPALSVYGIFKKFKVYGVGTTDDPADTLQWHEKIQNAGKTETRVLPSFRPDQVIAIESPGFWEYIRRLGSATGTTINSLPDLLRVLRDRIELFDRLGCCSSDHGLEYPPFDELWAAGAAKADDFGEREAAEAFNLALSGVPVEKPAQESYKAFILAFLGAEYYRHGWVMQLHFGALRNTNSRMLAALGPNTGFDVVHDHRLAEKLARFLNVLDVRGKLPATILYSLNPKDYYVLGTLMGSFQGGALSASGAPGIPGKIQLGSAWWFNDHRDGIEEQLRILGNLGLLACFVGMLTDSRSFLSYPRHEYFRRILCNLLGRWTEEGEIPHDLPFLKGMVRDICFENARRYFKGRRYRRDPPPGSDAGSLPAHERSQ